MRLSNSPGSTIILSEAKNPSDPSLSPRGFFAGTQTDKQLNLLKRWSRGRRTGATSGRFTGIFAALLLSGCGTTPAPAPAPPPDVTSAQITGRSLQDPGLRRFLVSNLGHEPAIWDFEALSWVAFYYHPSLAVARAQWVTARTVESSAGVRPNPTLSLAPGYNSTREAGISPWFPAVNFDFLLQGKRKVDLQRAAAAADAEAARLGVYAAVWQVRKDLRAALIDAATATHREALLRAQATAQARLAALLEQRRAAGAIAAADVLVARTAWVRAESAAADALNQSTHARPRIAAALGLPLAGLEGIALAPPTAAATRSSAELATARAHSLQTRADILAALAKYQSAQAAVELAVAKQQPDFHLGPGYQWDQGANKWSLALTFELPIFHHNEAPVAEAVARRAEAAAQFEVVQAQALAAMEAAVAAEKAAALQLTHARRLRGEVEKQNGLVRRRFDLGGADQVELQSAQLDLAATDSLIADAEATAVQAAGQLEDALQVPFTDLALLAKTPTDSSHPTP